MKISQHQRENIQGWIMVSPWILGFILWVAGPMVASLVISFTEWTLITPPKWAGTSNYVEMLSNDPLVWQALRVTTVYSLVSIPLRVVIGMMLALLLNSKIQGLQYYRTIYYLPAVLSGAAVSMLWRWIFSPDFGLLNMLLGRIGIRGPAWLSDSTWALPALIVMSMWGIGGGMVIYLAGLQGIPRVMYEAAEVDGANSWEKLWHITIPQMTPVVFFQLVMGIIGSLQTFTQGYLMTGGGPHNATLFFMLYLYRMAFQYRQLGFGSAVGMVIFVVSFGIALVQIWRFGLFRED